MCLTNNCINQLSLVDNKFSNDVIFNSVFAVIDNTSTNMGRRLLREKLLNPIADIKLLEQRYDYIDYFVKKEFNDSKEYIYKILEKYLSKILDIERLHRKLSLKLLQPCDFGGIDLSYENILNIHEFLKKYSSEDKIIKTLLLKENILKKFSEFIKLYNNDFNMEIITKFHLDKITSFF